MHSVEQKDEDFKVRARVEGTHVPQAAQRVSISPEERADFEEVSGALTPRTSRTNLSMPRAARM